MSLEEYFQKCKQDGITPLSYRSYKKMIDGKDRIVAYDNPVYLEAKARVRQMRKRDGKPEKGGIENLISGLYDKEVVIRKADGYHYGVLNGYDGKAFYLEDYCKADRLIDIFDFVGKKKEFDEKEISADGVVSIGKIPVRIDKKY